MSFLSISRSHIADRERWNVGRSAVEIIYTSIYICFRKWFDFDVGRMNGRQQITSE